MKRVLSCLVLCLMIFSIHAQSQHTNFVAIAPETLSNSYARCFFKDSYGFMWIGTAESLVRYDGTNVFRYSHDPEDITSISNNNINVITEDSNHDLWIGTIQGLNKYNRKKDNFINIDSIVIDKSPLNNEYVTALSFDQFGKLWIGTYGGGLNIFDSSTSKITYLSGFEQDEHPKSEDYITHLLCLDNLMWCGTKDGLKVFNSRDQIPASLTFDKESLPIKQVTQLNQDKFNNLWMTTLNGEIIKVMVRDRYYSFERKISGDVIYGTKWSTILALASDNKGNLWIAGDNSGLNYLNTKSNEITYFGADDKNPKKLPTNSIRSIYIDDAGLIWIGTFNMGVYRINNNMGMFDSYHWGDFSKSDLDGKSIRAFGEDKDKNVWIACDNIGLIKIDSNTSELRKCDEYSSLLTSQIYTSLLFDRNNDFWIGTGSEGVYKIDRKTMSVKKYSLVSSGFGDNKINNLFEDRRGIIWAGTNGSGLFYFDNKQQHFVSCINNKDIHITKNAYVNDMVEDTDSVLWVATMYGLFELTRQKNGSIDYQRFLPRTEKGSISSSGIYTLLLDDSDNLWIGTSDNGLNLKMKGSDQFLTYQKKEGLASNTIRGLLMDSQNNLWISGNMGISKYNPISQAFSNYDKLDGLSSNIFYNNACLHGSRGKFFFGSNSGFNAFIPDSVHRSLEIPKLYLTDLKINNQSVGIDSEDSPLTQQISFTSAIDLTYDQRSFTIDFVAINFTHTSNYEYCYMLEGFDKTWNCIGTNHSATYTNIDPGKYKFLMKLTNNDGVWNEKPLQLEITIRQVVWKTWWAIIIYLIVFAGIVYFLIRTRLERIKMKHELEFERKARDSEHELFELKTQFFTNISHEFRTPLSLITMPLENLSAMEDLPLSVKERISTIRSNSDKMLRLVNELMDFSKLESAKLKLNVSHGEVVSVVSAIAAVFNDLAAKRDIHFGVHTMIRSLDGWFDHDKLEKILVNILSNAFRFTPYNGQINLVINTKDLIYGAEQLKVRFLELTIADNGVGISEDELPYIFDKFYQAKSSNRTANPGTGIGLSLTKGLVELHNGSIVVESTSDQGAQFIILIPIDRQIYAEYEICDTQLSDEKSEPIVDFEKSETNDFELVEQSDREMPQILIVEDNDELRTYITLELHKHFQILEAKDGQEGIDMAMESSPDLIISDILMPIKTGIQLCQELKLNINTSHIPIILLTARTTVDDQVTGIANGADVYITKPFSIRFLLAQVSQLIKSRQKLYVRFSQDVYLMPHKIAESEIDQAFLQKAIDYIIENIQDPQLSVDSIAELFNLSRMQVYRKIKALTGKSVVDFVRMVRIKQALKLMNTQKYTLSEIAHQTGFSSASYFSRCFKDQYGKAPSEYLDR